MTKLPTDAPVWVDRDPILKKMVDDLSSQRLIAVDTESNSLYVYHEQVCLIQFSTDKVDYLVDPLALPDLSLLGPIFANPSIEKVFHAAEYDIICLKRDFHFEFRNIFDTMLVGRILGRAAVGLASMLQEEFQLDIDKHYQRANWGQRPLPQPLLAYARLDTHFLIALRDRLLPPLSTSGRMGLAQEDFQRMTQLDGMPSENGGGSCFKIQGSRELTPIQMAVLRSLCEYRDQQARRANLPPFKVLGNQTLLDIATRLPANMSDLVAAGGLKPHMTRRYGEGLFAAVQRGLSGQPVFRPQNHARPSDDYLARLDALRNWRKNTGQAIGVPSDVILPRETLETIAQENPRKLDDLRSLMGDLPWRLEEFGPEIIQVLKIH
jgi:ribonuclease D